MPACANEIPAAFFKERPIRRLTDLGRQALRKRVSLIVGPPGSGKTSLVGQIAREFEDDGWAVFRISCDKMDPPEALLVIEKALAACGEPCRTALIIDDAQVLLEKDFHAVRAAVLDLAADCPDSLHMVMTCIQNPGMALSRLRMEGELLEIGGEQLMLTKQEVSLLLRPLGIVLSAEALDSLWALTRGWLVGVRMFGLFARESEDMQDAIREFGSTNSWVTDFLFEEILPALDGDSRRLLHCVCELRMFSDGLAAVLLGVDRAASFLAVLRGYNLVVPVRSAPSGACSAEEAGEAWYTCHPLLIYGIRQAAFAETSSSQMRSMLMRAIDWYADRELYDLAVRTALSCGAFERAFQVMSEHLFPVLAQAESTELPQWLKAISCPEGSDEYLYNLMNAWSCFIGGQAKGAQHWLACAERSRNRTEALLHYKGTDNIYRTVKVGVMAFEGRYREAVMEGSASLDNLGGPQLFLRCTIMHNMGECFQRLGRYSEAYEYFTRARVNAEVAGRKAIMVLCDYELGWLQFSKGRLDAASNIYLRALSEYRLSEEDATWAIGLMNVGLARIYLQWGDTGKVHEYLDAAFQILHPDINRDAYLEAQVTLGRCLASEGRADEAFEVVVGAYEMVVLDSIPRGVGLLVLATFAEMLIDRGEFDRAEMILAEAREAMCADDTFYRVLLMLCEAKMDALRGDLSESEQLLTDAVDQAQKAGLWLLVGDCQVCLSCIYRLKGEKRQALDTMVDALEMSAVESRLYLFRGSWPHRNELIYEIAYPANSNLVETAHREHAQRFARLVMAQQQEWLSVQEAYDHGAASDEGLDALSEREREVYDLLKQGKTRKEIAESTGVSVNTVRTHVKNIYRKLDVHDRASL